MQQEIKYGARQNQNSRKIRYIAAFLVLGAGVVTLLALNVCIGTVEISFEDMLAFCRGEELNQTISRILWDIRMPRTLAAMILGGALALAGYLLQTFFHNPIAGPFVLGISSGAKMIVALVMVFMMGQSLKVTSATMILAAFLGAMVSMGFVLLMSRRVTNMSMLVVSGVMIGYICSAVTELVVTFADDADIVNLHNWSRGSFSGMTWENVQAMASVIAVTFVVVFMMYLHSVLEDKSGMSYNMVGALPGKCFDTGKSVRFGYIEVQEQDNKLRDMDAENNRLHSWLKSGVIRGHEFHYFDSEDNGADCLAIKPVTGKSYPCVIADENCFLGFPHLYYPSNPIFARSFVEKAAQYQERKGR